MHASSTCLCDGFVHTCQIHLESCVLVCQWWCAFLSWYGVGWQPCHYRLACRTGCFICSLAMPIFHLVNVVSSLPCWRPLWAYGMQYYLFLKRRRELPYGLNSYILSCLTTNIDFFKQNFVVCTWCIAKFSASTVAMLFGLSESLQYPGPEVPLLNVVTVVC